MPNKVLKILYSSPVWNLLNGKKSVSEIWNIQKCIAIDWWVNRNLWRSQTNNWANKRIFRMKELRLIMEHKPLGAQTVKNPPALQETWVRSLCQKDPLEEDMATHSSIHAWRIHGHMSLPIYSPWGCKESDKTEAD